EPAVDRWSSIDPSGPARSFLMSAWTGSKWLLYGGGDGVNTMADGVIYSVADDSWSDLPAGTQRRSDLTPAGSAGRETNGSGGGRRRVQPADQPRGRSDRHQPAGDAAVAGGGLDWHRNGHLRRDRRHRDGRIHLPVTASRALGWHTAPLLTWLAARPYPGGVA